MYPSAFLRKKDIRAWWVYSFFFFHPKQRWIVFVPYPLSDWSFISQWHENPPPWWTWHLCCPVCFFAVRKTPQSLRAFIPFSFVRFVGSETQAFNALLYAIRSCLGPPQWVHPCITGIQVGRSFTRINSVIWMRYFRIFTKIAGKYKRSVVERTHGLHETKQLFPVPVNEVMFYRIHWYNGIMVLWYTSGTVNDRCVVFCRNSIMSTVGTRVMSLMLLGLHYIHRFTFPWAIWRFGPCLQWKKDVGIYVYKNIQKRQDRHYTGVAILSVK